MYSRIGKPYSNVPEKPSSNEINAAFLGKGEPFRIWSAVTKLYSSDNRSKVSRKSAGVKFKLKSEENSDGVGEMS